MLMLPSWLTLRTNVCAALSNNQARNDMAAARAGFAGAPEDLQGIRVAASATGHAVEIGSSVAQGRPFCSHTLRENGTDGLVQAIDFRSCQGIGAPQRMNARQPERFIGVDIADSGDAGLVQQQRFDPAAPAGKLPAQDIDGEFIRQRLGAERR